MDPTDKRLPLIQKFLHKCNLSLFEGVLLTGSMVFGKHHSVNEQSDIDFIFILNPARVSHLKESPPFDTIDFSEDFVHAFSTHRIDRFWLEYLEGDIRINIGIWDSSFIESFVTLHAATLRQGTRNAKVQTFDAVDPYGTTHNYLPKVEAYRSIFIKTFELKAINELPILSPTYCNLIASELLYDPEDIWKKQIDTLIDTLNIQFGNAWFDIFLDYVLRKSSDEYLVQLRQRIATTSALRS